MKKTLLAGLSAAFIATAMFSGSAQASECSDYGTCPPKVSVKKKLVVKKQRVAQVYQSNKRKSVRTASTRKSSSKRIRTQSALAVAAPRGRGNVVALIKSQAPRMGVPAWFALRIAHVESGYNPRARGAAGELGVFQMKCQTARGLGFRGACSQLLNASTGVHWGLRHLQAAVRSSRGNLKLAASKHNGGLGRKTLVRKYVNLVF
jgi:soluble lytic murein transglycosylase-like protein